MEVMACAVVKMWSSLLRGGASSNMCREVELPEGVVVVGLVDQLVEVLEVKCRSSMWSCLRG